jgi:hypothetical protein
MSSTFFGSLYTFPSDLLDEGVPEVTAQARLLGMDRLAVAFAYHQARDVMPHPGAKGRLRYRRDGVFFEPDPKLWRDRPLRPEMQDAEERAVVSELLARPSGNVEAWTVFLHNSSLGVAHPHTASMTCFGDRIVSNLCPSNPDVIDYALTLARDIASRGVDIIAEALSAQTFGHGSHHERSFSPISAGHEALLGLCFCEHCASRASDLGADVEALRTATSSVVQDAYRASAELEATPAALAAAVGEDVLLLMSARERAVTDLARRVAEVVHSRGRRLSFMDLTGAVLGYDDGSPRGAAAADQAWRIAIVPGAVAPHADSYSILGYARDPQRLAEDVRSYIRVLGGTPLRVILRPGYPDTDSSEHLAAKVEACRSAGAASVDFYNYGMYDHSVLARIAAAHAAPAH